MEDACQRVQGLLEILSALPINRRFSPAARMVGTQACEVSADASTNFALVKGVYGARYSLFGSINAYAALTTSVARCRGAVGEVPERINALRNRSEQPYSLM